MGHIATFAIAHGVTALGFLLSAAPWLNACGSAETGRAGGGAAGSPFCAEIHCAL